MEAEDVELHTSPWVSGTRATEYFGPVFVDVFLPDKGVQERARDWARAHLGALELMRRRAHALGATDVVGVEVACDPFATDGEGAEGLRISVVGTAARLVPL